MEYNPNPISFNVFVQRSNNERLFMQISITVKDDDANANQLYDTTGTDDKENDSQNKPF